MIECKTFIPAQTILVDFQTKKVSAINIMEDSDVPRFPLLIPLMVYTAFSIEEEADIDKDNPNIVLTVFINGKAEIQFRLNVVFADGVLIAKNVVNIGTLPLNEDSEISFNITHGSENADLYTKKFRYVSKTT